VVGALAVAVLQEIHQIVGRFSSAGRDGAKAMAKKGAKPDSLRQSTRRVVGIDVMWVLVHAEAFGLSRASDM
jgi:hypothetical protein